MQNRHVHQSHPDIVKRLKRAEGHLRGVISMIGEGRSCLDAAANGRGKTTRSVVGEFKAISKYL